MKRKYIDRKGKDKKQKHDENEPIITYDEYNDYKTTLTEKQANITWYLLFLLI